MMSFHSTRLFFVVAVTLIGGVGFVVADDCSDMDKCWYQVASQCPPDVVVDVPAQAFCSDRLTACLGYVAKCNRAVPGLNITIDFQQSVPMWDVCSNGLNQCTKAITGQCAIRGLGTPIATATGGNYCPLKAICVADAKFCYCNTLNASCSFGLRLSSGGSKMLQHVETVLVIIGIIVGTLILLM